MTSHRVGTAIAGLALVLALAGCAATPAASPSISKAATPTPTPTPTALVVGPGQRPPLLAGGDCSRIITADRLTQVLGYPVTSVSPRGPGSDAEVQNLGGLTCEWRGDGPGGGISVLPESQLQGAQLNAVLRQHFFERCRYACSWEASRAGYWIEVSQDISSRDETPEGGPGPRVADAVAVGLAALDEDWTRDRTGWTRPLDCSSLAQVLGERLGVALTGTRSGYHDGPGPALAMANLGMGASLCAVGTTADDRQGLVWISPGMAWNVPGSNSPQSPLQVGVPGIAAYSVGGLYLSGSGYLLSDGINRAQLDVSDTAVFGRDAFVKAVAGLLHDGFAGVATGEASTG